MDEPESDSAKQLGGTKGSWFLIVAVLIGGLVGVGFFAFAAVFPQADNKGLDPLSDWKSADVNVGTVYLPQGFRQAGADPSQGRQVAFETPEIKVFVEWGEDVWPPAGRAANVERDSGQIGGHPVELYSFSDASEGNLPVGSLGKWKAMYVVHDESGLRITIWVTYSRLADAETADRIVRAFSIK